MVPLHDPEGAGRVWADGDAGVTSPTQRTLARLRADGWTAEVVERWNPYAKVRHDLFGFVDVVAMRPGTGLLAVQATSGANVAARLDKLASEPRTAVWLRSGGLLEVWGWRKTGPRGKRKTWAVRQVNGMLTPMGRVIWQEAST